MIKFEKELEAIEPHLLPHEKEAISRWVERIQLTSSREVQEAYGDACLVLTRSILKRIQALR